MKIFSFFVKVTVAVTAGILYLTGSAQALIINSLILEGLPEQGNIIYGKTNPESTVTAGVDDVPVAEDGRFVFGISKDNPDTLDVVSTDVNGIELRRTLKVIPVLWVEQTEDDVPDDYAAAPSKEDMDNIIKDSNAIKAARNTVITDYFPECFIMPVENAEISADFGITRIVRGIIKPYHGGIDLKTDEGTPVMASADGIVTHINTNSYYNGKMVIVNHGYGISSTYSHLSKIDVKIGQKLVRGDVIGETGNTGRSLYPHLHFGLHYGLMPVSPLKAILITKKSCNK